MTGGEWFYDRVLLYRDGTYTIKKSEDYAMHYPFNPDTFSLVSTSRYKIVVIKGLQRHYYIKVDTPNEFLITTGACNDDVRGFECDYSTAVQDVVSDARALSVDAPQRDLNAASAFAVSSASAPRPLGIRSGRSERCVYVDSEGNVEFNIDFGIMKVDDSRTVDTNVALLLEFDEEAVPESPSLRGRSLEAMLNRATVLGESRDGTLTTTRYLLGDDDKLAIGTVTAEILASSLDKRLEANGIELDDVTPKEVVVSRSKDSSKSERKASELAVAMQIKGHYNPPPDLDFDFIVQDSINRDTPEIRRNLREYNDNCRDQSSNTQAGYTEEDYSTVVSTTGAGRPVGRGGSRGSTLPQLGGSASFSKACSSNKVLPIYFETSLKEIEAKSIREVRVGGDEMIIFANEDRALEGWAMGPVAAIAGLIALLVGAFVFRRAIGPRRVDKYKESNKTKEVDMFETSRFGEGGGDDSSVDSDFYSDDEEDEKGRKISRKLKDKEDMDAKAKGRSSRRDIEKGSSKRASASALRSSLTKGTMSLRKSKQSTDGFAPEDKMSKRKKRASRAKLAASEGSNSTDSLDKGSNSSTEMDRDEQLKRSEKRNKRRSKINEDGSERKSKSEKRRGRSSRVGGDNSKLFEDSNEAEIL